MTSARRKEIEALLAENKRKDELVKTLAAGVRAAHTPDDGNCPVCLEDDGHADDCELGIALRAAEKAAI